MKNKLSALKLSALFFAAFLLLPSIARAHVGHGDATGFDHGFWHPFSGLDHLCAMIAVGLWAAQLGGRSLWAVPLAFVSVMALGAISGANGMTLPFVENGIVVSILVLGVLIAAAVRLPILGSTLIVGAFALFHGFAHGAEMPANALGALYFAGFLLATIILHVFGIAIGVGVQKMAAPSLVRFAGVAIALGGVLFWLF